MIKYSIPLTAIGLLLFASACASLPQPFPGTQLTATKGSSEPEASGIEGQVSLGPACPGPVSAESPCPDRPYQATIIVLDQNKDKVTQFQSAADGSFHLPLPPGDYILHPESPGALPRAGDQNVTVISGKFTQVQIIYDSGIR